MPRRHTREHMREIGRKGGRPTWQAAVEKGWRLEDEYQQRVRDVRRRNGQASGVSSAGAPEEA